MEKGCDLILRDVYIFDFEVYANDWLVVFKHVASGEYLIYHNDNQGIAEFMATNPLLAGWNNKNYDNFILKAILLNWEPEEVKHVNDLIIKEGVRGWEIPGLNGRYIPIRSFDLKDDTQVGLSLKSVEGHLKMDIEEEGVDFDLDRPMTPEEVEKTIFYCKHDVDATEQIFHIRRSYLENKLYLGTLCNLEPERALYMTNAKLTASYLGAARPIQERSDERNYELAEKLLIKWIPEEVREFFGRLKDRSIPDEQVFSEKCNILIGDCPITIGYGGIHGAIPNYTEMSTDNRYNNLYDPLMGRSVCISGQLFLLELAEHLYTECDSLEIIQVNTDGIMVSFDLADEERYYEICKEWQRRTGFELEEDLIKKIIQKDVNNYIEVPEQGTPKIKGGDLVRGIAPAGAFNINNNAEVISQAVYNYFVHGYPVQKTVDETEDILAYQLIAKASGKYSEVYRVVMGEKVPVQRCNRVYATDNLTFGTLYKVHKETGQMSKVPSLPLHCLIDNRNTLSVEDIDRSWYVRQAEKVIMNFLGKKEPKKNTRKINKIKREGLALLGE